MVSKKGGAKPAAKIGAKVAQPNSGVGTTGVELRYHTTAEYKLLTQAQRDEVSEYSRNKNPNWKGKVKGKGKGKGKGSPSTKRGRNKGSPPSEKNIKTMISSALAELVKDSSQTEAFAETLKTFVSSYVSTQSGTATIGAAAGLLAEEKQHTSAVVAVGKLQAILDISKKVKFSK